MSNELIFKGATLALDLIEYAVENRANETDLLAELQKPEYTDFTEEQKLQIVQRLTDQSIDSAQAAIDAIAEEAPGAPD